ncbi:hypothetical protein [Streptomyces agglomeratus]|uniref:hypothetical protein n=1 Tax=Streptomyces agglomeratus TaxID=285458 RepID=UPI00114C872E|nr:hypothetical protein [Streptomyces agglomeratus]
MSRDESNYSVDRVSLFLYRVRAAQYGLKIRSRRFKLEAIGLAGVIIGLVGVWLGLNFEWLKPVKSLYVSAFSEHPMPTVALTATFLAGIAWGLIRRFGNLSRVMLVASATDEGAEEVRSCMSAGMRNYAAYTQLRLLYDENIRDANVHLQDAGWKQSFEFVQIGGYQYASAALPLREPTRLDNLINSTMNAQVSDHQFADMAESRQKLMGALRRNITDAARRNIERGANYRVIEMEFRQNGNGPPRVLLDVGVTSYGKIMRSCDAMINEFALFAFLAGSNCSGMRPTTVLKCLPWRKRVHDAARSPGDLFLHPVDRAAGLGVAVATIMDNGEHQKVVGLGWRSEEVGTYPACWHVIPAGMCNTHDTHRGRTLPNWYLTTTMRSEYLEEWFNDLQLEKGQMPYWREQVVDRWKEKAADRQIVLTGLAFDLLNLRPEVCAGVIVPKWGNELSWEYESGVAAYAEILGAPSKEIEPTQMVQSGAAAIFLAERYAMEIKAHLR